MIIDEEVYLEHFGVKGMRWGVRKARSPSQSQSDKPTSRKKTALKIGVGVIGAAAVVGGGVLLARRLGKKKSTVAGVKAAKTVLKNTGSTKASSVRGVVSPEAKAWMDKFTSDQNALIKLANADLKAGYERGMVPFPKREYLKEWT